MAVDQGEYNLNFQYKAIANTSYKVLCVFSFLLPVSLCSLLTDCQHLRVAQSDF